MGAERGRLLTLLAVGAVACGGSDARLEAAPNRTARALQERFPVRPCGDERLDAVGVWQTAERDWAFVYDGCSVRLFETLEREPAIFGGLRNVARAFVIDVRDYADPFPYFRTHARWEGAVLQSVSILETRSIAVWRDGRFWSMRDAAAYHRAEAVDEVGSLARDLLLVERFLPTEAEIAATRGIEVPPPDGRAPDLIWDVLCPTRNCGPVEIGPPLDEE